MGTEAQVLANRLNAQKSTGPRTAEGKAGVSQNAVQHGLLARQVVIKGEDPGQFETYREQMLGELAPVGAVEALLAERAVSLAWRLRRAERLQSSVFETVYRENADDVVLWPTHGLPSKPGPDDDEVILGHVVMTDFARARVLERLAVYERRIENSLYRTLAELRQQRRSRPSQPPVADPSRETNPISAGPAEASGTTGLVPMNEGQQDTGSVPSPGAFGCVITTNGADDSSCKTNPIRGTVQNEGRSLKSEVTRAPATSNLTLETASLTLTG